MTKLIDVTLATTGNTRARVTITIPGLGQIRDIRVVQGKNGLFVSNPSRSYNGPDGDVRHFDIVRLNEETQNEVMLAFATKTHEATVAAQVPTAEEPAQASV